MSCELGPCAPFAIESWLNKEIGERSNVVIPYLQAYLVNYLDEDGDFPVVEKGLIMSTGAPYPSWRVAFDRLSRVRLDTTKSGNDGGGGFDWIYADPPFGNQTVGWDFKFGSPGKVSIDVKNIFAAVPWHRIDIEATCTILRGNFFLNNGTNEFGSGNPDVYPGWRGYANRTWGEANLSIGSPCGAHYFAFWYAVDKDGAGTEHAKADVLKIKGLGELGVRLEEAVAYAWRGWTAVCTSPPHSYCDYVQREKSGTDLQAHIEMEFQNGVFDLALAPLLADKRGDGVNKVDVELHASGLERLDLFVDGEFGNDHEGNDLNGLQDADLGWFMNGNGHLDFAVALADACRFLICYDMSHLQVDVSPTLASNEDDVDLRPTYWFDLPCNEELFSLSRVTADEEDRCHGRFRFRTMRG